MYTHLLSGGYSSDCTDCMGTSAYEYSCSCKGVTAVVDLSKLAPYLDESVDTNVY